ncbi:MAG: hypothetical protein F6K42_26995 [Leptolyngbya sp. SIO1D8]|nr:hypothetical protein [Leptolyngbya sp. SIO1D8]
MRRINSWKSNSDLSERLAIGVIIASGIVLFLAVLKLLLPWLLLLGAIAFAIKLWSRYRQKGQALNSLFYAMLQQNQGRISVLEFAMAAQITGTAARSFLDARAKEFFADFEPTQQGDVTYVFALPQGSSKST